MLLSVFTDDSHFQFDLIWCVSFRFCFWNFKSSVCCCCSCWYLCLIWTDFGQILIFLGQKSKIAITTQLQQQQWQIHTYVHMYLVGWIQFDVRGRWGGVLWKSIKYKQCRNNHRHQTKSPRKDYNDNYFWNWSFEYHLCIKVFLCMSPFNIKSPPHQTKLNISKENWFIVWVCVCEWVFMCFFLILLNAASSFLIVCPLTPKTLPSKRQGVLL